MEDIHAVKQVLQGDKEAFNLLVQRHMNKIYLLLFRMIGNAEEAKDLTQECFIRAYNHLSQYDEQYAFTSWLYKIACNLCHNEIQKQKRRKTTVHADIEVNVLENPETVLLSQEKKEILLTRLEQMPEMYRTVLILRYQEDLSYIEIANILGISKKKVSNYLYRAKQSLREKFNKDEREVLI